ncbi:hypothetical protein scyTo_0003235 [Scyliorhinus torazame]|uniref:Uncharacterized protein n=1 Tax=Scyliorhinus torazame TaxID=75743 RepID=A0A401PM14_SCYTO|nr:hypothetical protein [Scyliorhinus torazame]
MGPELPQLKTRVSTTVCTLSAPLNRQRFQTVLGVRETQCSKEASADFKVLVFIQTFVPFLTSEKLSRSNLPNCARNRFSSLHLRRIASSPLAAGFDFVNFLTRKADRRESKVLFRCQHFD